MTERVLPEPPATPEDAHPMPAVQRRGWRLWRRLGLALLLVMVLTLAGLPSLIYWGAYSDEGTAWWLTHWPGLTIQGPRGHLMGEFAAEEIQLALPGGSQLQVQGLRWSGLQFKRADAPTAWVHVHLTQLHARNVILKRTTPRASAAAPSHLRLPLQLSIQAASADELRLPSLGEEPLRALQARVFLGDDAGQVHRIDALQLQWGRVKAQGSGQVRSDESMATQGELQAQALFEFPARSNPTTPAPWRMTLHANGPLPRLNLKATLRSDREPLLNNPLPSRGMSAPRPPAALDAQAEIRPFEAWPLGLLQAQAAQLDLSAFHALAPHTAMSGHIELRTQDASTPASAQLQLRNEEAGLWNEGRLPVRQLSLAASGLLKANQKVELQHFEIDLGSAQRTAGRITGQGHMAPDEWALATQWLAVLPEGLDSRAAAMRLSGPVAATGQWQAMGIQLKAQLQGQLTRVGLAPELLIRPEEASTPVRAEPVEAQGVRATLRQAQGERFKLHQGGSIAAAAPTQPATDSPTSRDVQITIDAQGQALQWTIDKFLAQAGAATLSVQGNAKRQAPDLPWRVSGQAQIRRFDPRPWWRDDPAGTVAQALRQAPSDFNANAQWDVQLPPQSAPKPGASWLSRWRGQAELEIQPSQLSGVALQGRAQWRHDGTRPATMRLSLDAEGNQLSLDSAPQGDARENANFPLRLTVNAPELQRLSPLWRLLGGPVEAGSKQAPLSGALQAQVNLTGPSAKEQDWFSGYSSGTASAQALRAGPWRLTQGKASWQGSLTASAPLQVQAELQEAVLRGFTLSRLSLGIKGRSDAHQIRVQAESPSQPPQWVDALQGAQDSNKIARTETPGNPRPAAPHSVAVLEAAGGFSRDDRSHTLGWAGAIEKLLIGSSDPQSSPWWRSSNVALSVEGLSPPQDPPADINANANVSKPAFRPRLTLQAGRAELPGAALRWERMHWQAAGGGMPAQIEANAELEPLSVAPLLARLQPDFGWGGDLRVGAHLKLKSNPGFEADVLIERLDGDLSVTEDGLPLALGLSDLRLALSARNGVWNFSQGMAGSTLGVMAGLIVARTSPNASWPAADAPIDGVVELQVANLGTWGTWVPAGWRLGGQLRTSATLGGRFGAPEITGRLEGSGLSVRNVVEGVAISGGEVNLSLQGDVARIEKFTAKAGNGSVTLTGQADLGAKRQANLTLATEQFQLLGRVDRRIVTTGQAQLQLTGDSLELAGRLSVDEGLIDISKRDAPSLGEDVVVTRADSPPTANDTTKPVSPKTPNSKATKVKLDLQVDLGEKLRLRGRGLNTGLAGELRLTSPNNKLAINGTVRTVGGTYAAYQQKLNIDRGLITFTGNPSVARLDIEATRPNTDVRVGVAVTGTTVTPRVRLFSEPELPEIDKLSWLVLGRESSGVGGTDLALLQRAALGLLAGEEGGSTDQLINNLGLDSLSLRQGNATSVGETRDTIVSLGKQVSRDWYVGYERSLNATTGNWQLIYRLAQRFTLRAQSGLENSLDVIWTWRWQ